MCTDLVVRLGIPSSDTLISRGLWQDYISFIGMVVIGMFPSSFALWHTWDYLAKIVRWLRPHGPPGTPTVHRCPQPRSVESIDSSWDGRNGSRVRCGLGQHSVDIANRTQSPGAGWLLSLPFIGSPVALIASLIANDASSLTILARHQTLWSSILPLVDSSIIVVLSGNRIKFTPSRNLSGTVLAGLVPTSTAYQSLDGVCSLV